MIFAVFDVLLAVNMCINYSFFTFIIIIITITIIITIVIIISNNNFHQESVGG